MTQIKPIILASGSSYKKQILQKLKIDFMAKNPEVDEQALFDESPDILAQRLAKEKALALCDKYTNHLIIGSDQVAMFRDIQLTKPGSKEKAIQQLQLISGHSVSFYTSICLLDSSSHKIAEDIDYCSVKFRTLSTDAIEHYIELDQPLDCAGSFKSESLGIALIESISGSDPNALMGLPLIKLINLLTIFSVKIL